MFFSLSDNWSSSFAIKVKFLICGFSMLKRNVRFLWKNRKFTRFGNTLVKFTSVKRWWRVFSWRCALILWREGLWLRTVLRIWNSLTFGLDGREGIISSSLQYFIVDIWGSTISLFSFEITLVHYWTQGDVVYRGLTGRRHYASFKSEFFYKLSFSSSKAVVL